MLEKYIATYNKSKYISANRPIFVVSGKERLIFWNMTVPLIAAYKKSKENSGTGCFNAFSNERVTRSGCDN